MVPAMDDDYDTRLTRALAELEASGIKRSNYAPPLFHLARRLGARPRLPHYMGFWQAVALTGPFFAVTWGLFMWIVFWLPRGLTGWAALLAALVAGLLFGIGMALYYRYSAKRAGLSRWEAL